MQHQDASPLRSVLVATDLSDRGRRAVMRAARLPLAAAAEVEILHVLTEPRLTPSEEIELAEETATAASTIAREQASVRVLPQMDSGSLAEVILQRASARGAELVVLGRHRRRFFRDLVFDSTVERVIRASTLPVLVVSGHGTRAYRRPLVALDVPSKSCRRSLEVALRVLGPAVDRIDVVHALDDSADWLLLRAGYPTSDVLRERDVRARRARASIHEFLASLDSEGIQWRTSVVADDPRRAVLKAAARRRSDLIILGTESRAGIEGLLFASTAERVLRGAACDVLIARSVDVEVLYDAA